VSGALAERVFAQKMTNVGFVGVERLARRGFGLADAARYPLFTPDLIEVMGRLIPAERQAEVAVAVTVAGRKPARGEAPARPG